MTDVSASEQTFFTALQRADGAALDHLLADDFLMIDVMRGGEIGRDELIHAVAAGVIRFAGITLVASRVRTYGDTAIVTGHTEMHGTAGEQPWRARSRYTHVYVRRDARWQLASAQGTPIAD